jgi:hypothetical protein
MAVTFQFYSDAALTLPITSQGFVQAADASIPPDQRNVFFGSTTASRTLKEATNPGVNNINLTPTDSGIGTGEPATAVKLSLTQAGLATATAGAALSLGTQVLSGSANAKSVWIQVTDATAVVGTYTDLSLQTSSVVES